MEESGDPSFELVKEWAWLPENLLDSILDRLIASDSAGDCIRFSAVCKRWLSVAQHNIRKCRKAHPLIASSRPKLIPMLMIPSKDGSTDERSLINLMDRGTLPLRMRVPYYRRCCGSSHGWLAFALDDLSIVLFNPFTDKRIQLPSLFQGLEPPNEGQFGHPLRRDYYVEKVILSADPASNDDYVVTIIHGNSLQLAFLNSADRAWKSVYTKKRSGESLEELKGISDVIYHRGRVYAVSYLNNIYHFSIESPTALKVFVCYRADVIDARQYLVESSNGCLYLILRYTSCGYLDDIRNFRTYITKSFTVYRLERKDGSLVMHDTEDLDGHAFFIGDNHSTAVFVSHSASSCPPNTIYCTHNVNSYGCCREESNVCSYDYKTRSFKAPVYMMDHSHRNIPPAIWIQPPQAPLRTNNFYLVI